MVDSMINKILDKPNVTSMIMLNEIECIATDEEDLLPIPVISPISPENPIQFLIHIILTMGNYQTEIDAMNHPSFRDCFQKVRLIGDNDDEESLQQYVKDITRLYIASQVVYYPNSMKKKETFIVMAHGIFEDVIIKNAIPNFELPPYTMNDLRDTKTEENTAFWRSLKNSQ